MPIVWRVNCCSKVIISEYYFWGALPELPIGREREQGFRRAIANHPQIATDFLYAKKFHKNLTEAFATWLSDHGLPQVIFTTSLTLLQGVFVFITAAKRHVVPRL